MKLSEDNDDGDVFMKVKKRDWGFVLVLIFICILLLLRCFYGIGIKFSDEFAQPAAVKRFLQGDRLLIDDWHPPTMLLGYIISNIIRFLPIGGISLIGIRITYVLFQLLVALVIMCGLGWNDATGRIIAITYLLSTPYGIMSICYNTVAIAGILIFLVLAFGNDVGNIRVKCFFAGISLAFSVASIPHVVIIFVLYCVATAILSIRHIDNSFFSPQKLLWIFVGIMVLFIPFCIGVFTGGTFLEYGTNLKYILNDSEHNKSLSIKLVASFYQMIRVYWRAWFPLVVIDCIIVILHKHRINRSFVYLFSCLVIIYATVRFAFIYGSVSINLMLGPMVFYGLQAIFLLFLWKETLQLYLRDIIWFAVGYLFATCDYLATNTEILSMSAMLIVPALAAISINLKLIKGSLKNNSIAYFGVLATIGTFMCSLLILRMTFIWGDLPATEQTVKIESGFARGIYSTEESVKEYNRVQNVIKKSELKENDRVLFVPANPMYYLMADSEIATPYVIRFNTDIEELNAYYLLHDNKIPTKVVVIKGIENHSVEADVVDYFVTRNYQCKINDEDYVILEKK